LLLPAETVGIT